MLKDQIDKYKDSISIEFDKDIKQFSVFTVPTQRFYVDSLDQLELRLFRRIETNLELDEIKKWFRVAIYAFVDTLRISDKDLTWEQTLKQLESKYKFEFSIFDSSVSNNRFSHEIDRQLRGVVFNQMVKDFLVEYGLEFFWIYASAWVNIYEPESNRYYPFCPKSIEKVLGIRLNWSWKELCRDKLLTGHW
jgi:hypothetical protein